MSKKGSNPIVWRDSTQRSRLLNTCVYFRFHSERAFWGEGEQNNKKKKKHGKKKKKKLGKVIQYNNTTASVIVRLTDFVRGKKRKELGKVIEYNNNIASVIVKLTDFLRGKKKEKKHKTQQIGKVTELITFADNSPSPHNCR